MNQIVKAPSLQAYAARLRKALLKGQPIEKLLDLHQANQTYLARFRLRNLKLAPPDRFAFEFIERVEILRPDFKSGYQRLGGQGHGIFQDLTERMIRTQQLYFPEMKTYPKVVWLDRFSTRKLAHYSLNRDEIAFSLIFDRLNAPKVLLDYLAFHELLHKDVGIKRQKGRISAHGPDFKAREREYPGFKEIEPLIHRFMRGDL
ncbi:MAG: hypothetical protein A2508_06755 [Candidatus Lambdaproteobacteria bacterium RIFOXYD12_FULL_49_8]|uniref:SprT-like domain-containing protein n=1 Tax=Candidatus Lambdaproteobacteria bacterium RIFOXYD2_FULL_50_16 TaxID=1817772 RepID=A0A1F6G9J7_9PROT|nr:MAG: hypothetical protein A2527_05995 [Candidatus Lambdaproteobacteria bacterium RIFOXYD2_FULL_50_16]OGG97417.1 MAG: hypothetical protein A2508_06755 [Candidatus Lambdaproteobacteria bacterium RIFOXYD12_FULL_49_8]